MQALRMYVLITVVFSQLGPTREVHLKKKKKSTGNSFLFPQTKLKSEAMVLQVCVRMRVFNF